MRALAKKILSLNKKGTQLRHARGVVVSSTLGTTTLTIDGGSTNITAFNYGHVNSIMAGAVVDVLLVGRKAYVVGSYDGDVPVGGVVASATGPGSDTSYSGAAATIFTRGVPLITGHTYQLTLGVINAQQITNASTGSFVYCSDSAGLILGGGGLVRAAAGGLAANEALVGTGTCLLVAASTGTDTITVTAQANAASLKVFANSVKLIITRVA